MLLQQHTLESIRHGAITLAFRRWRRPTVKSNGTLMTAAGQLHLGSVSVTPAADITDAEAIKAGYASRAELIAELDLRQEGAIYRIEFGTLTPDPRIALRERVTLDPAELQSLIERLRKIDVRADGGAWTRRVLVVLRDQPAVRAADLCLVIGQEKLVFKTNVRKLKALGLTESLEVGYRLSPRGAALLEAIERA